MVILVLATSTGMVWSKNIYALDFPTQKEVILFQCEWYDVPAASRSKGRGFNKDQYGIIDIDTTR